MTATPRGPEGSCTYCRRPFGDPRGCRYPGCATAPVPVSGTICSACGTLRGKLHHALCPDAKCRKCGGFYARCFAVDCEVSDVA